jgi:hypothetical protein
VDGIVWAALVTALGALAVAVFGWWANRAAGVPSQVQQAVRQERKLYEQALERKAKRLEEELNVERTERARASQECEDRVNKLTDALIERDVIIARLHQRLGLPRPHVVDPRS